MLDFKQGDTVEYSILSLINLVLLSQPQQPRHEYTWLLFWKNSSNIFSENDVKEL
jgi:hypothetical protein